MEDLMATIEGFSEGCYNPEDYREQLKKDGILVRNREGKEWWDYGIMNFYGVLPDKFIVAEWRELVAIKRQWEKRNIKT